MALERRERSGQLMPEHIVPFALDLRPEGRSKQGLKRRNVNAGVCALLLQNTSDVDGTADEVGVPMQVDDVVEVPRAAAFGERSQLLAEQLGNRGCNHAPHGERMVAVLMTDWAKLGA